MLSPSSGFAVVKKHPPIPDLWLARMFLLDLDGTLLSTDLLEAFRGPHVLGAWPSSRIAALRQKLVELDRSGYPLRIISEDGLRWLNGRSATLGVITRSPRSYAETLLSYAYPDWKWHILIAREDVATPKPNPEGVIKAALASACSPADIVVIGNEWSDMVTAYRAGARCALLENHQPLWGARECIPDAILNDAGMLRSFHTDIGLALPPLEQAFLYPQKKLEPNHLRLDKVDCSHVYALGRYYPTDLAREWHKNSGYDHHTTRALLDAKDGAPYPQSVVQTVRAAILSIRSRILYPVPTIVTVIPAKPGRPKRMEGLLDSVARSLSSEEGLHFIPDVFSFSPGAASFHADRLGRAARLQDMQEHLQLQWQKKSTKADVIVIDDIVTSGSTFKVAEGLLRNAGVRLVTSLALAKTIGTRAR